MQNDGGEPNAIDSLVIHSYYNVLRFFYFRQVFAAVRSYMTASSSLLSDESPPKRGSSSLSESKRAWAADDSRLATIVLMARGRLTLTAASSISSNGGA